MTALILTGSVLTSCGAGSLQGTQPAKKGVLAVEAVYPEPIAEGKDAQAFSDSDEHWDWWDGYREKVSISAEFQPDMKEYNQALMEQMLVVEDDNSVCSPLNIYVALAMLAEITDGKTRAQILSALQVEDIETLRSRITALWESNYVDTPMLKSLLADSLWMRDGVKYNEETLDRLVKEYYASAFSGATGSEEMNQKLRDWTDKNTGGLLSEYTKDMKLDAETVIALVSTIYYKAAWYDEFRSENNTQETFHGTKGDTTVEMMHRTDMMGVFRTDAFTSIGLGLQDSGSMFFFLPNEGVDVNTLPGNDDVLSALTYSDDDRWSYPEVDLSLPKFKISGNVDLLDTIKALGIKDALDTATADFSPLTKENNELYLSAAEHAAMVEIDENGVTGAAYTMLAVAESAALVEDKLELVFDRPFLFVVTGADGSVLFSGIVRNIE